MKVFPATLIVVISGALGLGACGVDAPKSSVMPTSLATRELPATLDAEGALTATREARLAESFATRDAAATRRAALTASVATLYAKRTAFAPTPTPDLCIHWDQVSVQMEGQIVCVRDIPIARSKFQDGQEWVFSPDPSTFSMRTSKVWEFGFSREEFTETYCLQGKGKIYVANGVPWMNTDEGATDWLEPSVCEAMPPARPVDSNAGGVPCIEAAEVTPEMVGETVCVKGIAQRGQILFRLWQTRFILGMEPKAFFVAVPGIYVNAQGGLATNDKGEIAGTGRCVIVKGKLHLSTEGAPFINVAEENPDWRNSALPSWQSSRCN